MASYGNRSNDRSTKQRDDRRRMGDQGRGRSRKRRNNYDQLQHYHGQDNQWGRGSGGGSSNWDQSWGDYDDQSWDGYNESWGGYDNQSWGGGYDQQGWNQEEGYNDYQDGYQWSEQDYWGEEGYYEDDYSHRRKRGRFQGGYQGGFHDNYANDPYSVNFYGDYEESYEGRRGGRYGGGGGRRRKRSGGSGFKPLLPDSVKRSNRRKSGGSLPLHIPRNVSKAEEAIYEKHREVTVSKVKRMLVNDCVYAMLNALKLTATRLANEYEESSNDNNHNDGNVEAAIADATIADSAIADSAVSDTAVADTAIADSAIADSAVSDTAVADTAIADSAVSDTAVADTAIADSAIADSAVSDTAVADTAIADSAISDTAVADTGITDTAMADSATADSAITDTGIADATSVDNAAPENEGEVGKELTTENGKEIQLDTEPTSIASNEEGNKSEAEVELVTDTGKEVPPEVNPAVTEKPRKKKAVPVILGAIKCGEAAMRILVGDTIQSIIVVLAEQKPTRKLLARVKEIFEVHLGKEKYMKDKKFTVLINDESECIVVRREDIPGFEAVVRLTSPAWSAEAEPEEDAEKTEPEDLLSEKSCLEGLIAIRRLRYFTTKLDPLKAALTVIRILLHFRATDEIWSKLSGWSILVLVGAAIESADEQKRVTNKEGTENEEEMQRVDFILKRCMEILACGVLLPSSFGLKDPCERDVDACEYLSVEDSESITKSAQSNLRCMEFRKLRSLLGLPEKD